MATKTAATTKSATSKTTASKKTTRTRTTAVRAPEHDQIAERAYFIHLDEGQSDPFGNWLRAERELMAA